MKSTPPVQINSLTETPIERVEKSELGFPGFRNTKAGGTGLRITRLQACTTAEGGINR